MRKRKRLSSTSLGRAFQSSSTCPTCGTILLMNSMKSSLKKGVSTSNSSQRVQHYTRKQMESCSQSSSSSSEEEEERQRKYKVFNFFSNVGIWSLSWHWYSFIFKGPYRGTSKTVTSSGGGSDEEKCKRRKRSKATSTSINKEHN